MALSLLRFGSKAGALIQSSMKTAPNAILVMSSRSLVTKKFKKPSDKPAPFDYNHQPYGWITAMFDDTEARFDENTRIIVVDGNVATGKHELAKKIADEFDLYHFPAANMDFAFVDDDGYDVRSWAEHMPPRTRPIDVPKYNEDPFALLVSEFQYTMFGIRYEQYLDAMAHVLHTGQGCVMERSVYSDIMFIETMLAMKHVSKEDHEVYMKMRRRIMESPIWKPHVLIYLEASVDSIMSRIKKRGRPHEVNSKALTPDYVKLLDENYKQKYLRNAKDHSEVLVYDVTDPFDFDFVIEDLERLPLDKIMEDYRNLKCKDWKQRNPRELDEFRMKVTNLKTPLYNQCFMSIYRHNHPEYLITEDEYWGYEDARELYEPKYEADKYNPEKSGLNYLFESTTFNPRTHGRIFYRTR